MSRLSPVDDSGAAGRAIRAFREANLDALIAYHGTDPRLAVSGPRASACGAVVLLVGGILYGNLIFRLGTALLLKRKEAVEPSLEFYAQLLEFTCSEGPFWRLRKLIMPVSEVE